MDIQERMMQHSKMAVLWAKAHEAIEHNKTAKIEWMPAHKKLEQAQEEGIPGKWWSGNDLADKSFVASPPV